MRFQINIIFKMLKIKKKHQAWITLY